MKTAFEIAMERLHRKDAESGETETRLTDKQKKEIAEVRGFYKAKLAEREILHHADLVKARAAREEETVLKVEAEYKVDRRRIEDEMESKVRAIRRAGVE